MAFLPFLLASAGVAELSNRDVERRQRRIIDAMEKFQTKKARQGEKSIDDFLQTITPEKRAAENANVRDELGRGLQESVGVAQAFERPESYAGKVTEGFAGRKASNEAAVKDRIEKAMQQLAVIGSPAEAGLRQQTRFGRVGGEVDATNRAIRNVGGAYEGAISRVRPSAFDTFLSQALAGAGMASAGGAGAGTLLAGARRRPRTSTHTFSPNLPGAEYPGSL